MKGKTVIVGKRTKTYKTVRQLNSRISDEATYICPTPVSTTTLGLGPYSPVVSASNSPVVSASYSPAVFASNSPAVSTSNTNHNPNITSTFIKEFEFPFSWIWNNIISGVKFTANSKYATSQIHIIQNFELDKSTILYDTSFVCVLLKLLKLSNQKKRVIAICSSFDCKSSRDLIR